VKKNPNPKVFLFLALGTILGGTALVFTQATSLSDKRTSVERLRQETQDEVKVRDQLANSERLLLEATAKLDHLEKNVPTAAYVPTMLQELERVGKEQGIKVVGVRPALKPVAKPRQEGDAEPIRKPYDELDIEVKGRGSYEAIESFVKSLQSFPKVVAARMVSISPHIDPLNPGQPQLEVAVELRAFLFKAGEGRKQEAKA
jgi:Tfp pilus assembly protein PilO